MNTKIIDGTRTLKAVLCAAMLSSCLGWATDAVAAKSFFCKATVDQGLSPQSLSGPLVYDMGILGSCTDVQYGGPNYNSKCSGPAQDACSQHAAGDANFNSAAFWCAKGLPNGSKIIAYSAAGPPDAPFGKGRYKAAQTKGVLINKAAVTNTTYDCNSLPGTWLDPPTAGNGHHARCVKDYCTGNSGVPAPPAWTSIGPSWTNTAGAAWVTSDKANIWYGVPAHATTVVVSPAECRWQ